MKDKKWLKEKVREIARRVGDEHLYINIDTILKLIDQLDEPEVLSQELPVIPEHIVESITRAFDVETTSKTIEALTGMTIEQVAEEIRDGKFVPKQDVPVVPMWFDEWWKDVTKGGGNLFHNIELFYDELFSSGTREMYNYISGPDNKKKLLDIIVNELDYVVEEEQLYYVVKDGVVILSKRYRDYDSHKSHWIGTVTNKEYIKENPDKVRFTEQEIKDYDERFWSFAVPVEELE